MARWTASAKWAAGPALDGQRDMPLSLRLSEGLGSAGYDRGGWVTLFYPRMGDIPIGSEVNAADQFANSWRQKF